MKIAEWDTAEQWWELWTTGEFMPFYGGDFTLMASMKELILNSEGAANFSRESENADFF